MPRLKFSDLSLRALKPPSSGQVTYWDASEHGFGMRVSQAGSKTFVLMVGRQRRRLTVGRFPEMGLADARKQARKLRAQATLAVRPGASIAFDEALELFFSTHCASNRPNTNAETFRILRTRFLPVFKSRDLSEIISRDIVAITDPIVRDGKPSAANHAFTEIRTFFRWSVRRGYIQLSPCQSLKLPARPSTRDRVLDDEELRAVLAATFTDPVSQHNLIVRLLLLTGQRRNEIASLKWSMINEQERMITWPSAMTKNKREHTIPYGDLTAAALALVSRNDNLLFPARGRSTPFNGWSKAKRELDAACQIAAWTLHDLRRTYSTNLSKLGVQPHITERLLNHATGQISGVAAVYNRWSYLPEMREAVGRCEHHVKRLIS